jgi:hypothetical protein
MHIEFWLERTGKRIFEKSRWENNIRNAFTGMGENRNLHMLGYSVGLCGDGSLDAITTI